MDPATEVQQLRLAFWSSGPVLKRANAKPRLYLDLITLDELFHLSLTEKNEFFMLHHFRKMLLAKNLSCLHQINTVVSFRKVPDTQAVRRVQLAFQELAAGLLHA